MNTQEPFIPTLEQVMKKIIVAIGYSQAVKISAQQANQPGLSFITPGGTNANKCSS